MLLTDLQRQILKNHVAALRDEARTLDATANLFRPEFEACWERRADGSMGQMLDQKRALQLQSFVLDGPKNAKYNRELADAIENSLSASSVQVLEVGDA